MKTIFIIIACALAVVILGTALHVPIAVQILCGGLLGFKIPSWVRR